MISLPRLYAIVDPALLKDGSTSGVLSFVRELINGGATLIQLRNKSGNTQEILSQAREMRRVTSLYSSGVHLIMNDRADLCLAADFDGVHVGKEDLTPEGARQVIGSRRWLGISTHNPEQVQVADRTNADYIAIGPIFQTSSKRNPDPVIGFEGIRAARELTSKPLVAIGGITLENCRPVMDAGVDGVAIISALLDEPRKRTEAFLRKLG